MKKVLLFGFAFLVVTLSLSAIGAKEVIGNGNVIEEIREINDITHINLATIGHMIISIGSAESLRIEAENNIMEFIKTEVLFGRLIIGTKDRVNLRTTKTINYYLTVKSLDKIEITSAGDIEVPDLTSKQLSIMISSSGNLDMGNLKCDMLTAKISSSGDVKMGILNAGILNVNISSSGNMVIDSGEVEIQKIKISSSGNYVAGNTVSKEADVNLSSSGSATIWVLDYIKAILNSSGHLRYRGLPRVKSTTNSSGDIIQIDN